MALCSSSISARCDALEMQLTIWKPPQKKKKAARSVVLPSDNVGLGTLTSFRWGFVSSHCFSGGSRIEPPGHICTRAAKASRLKVAQVRLAGVPRARGILL